MTSPHHAVVRWLRHGYPEGVPERDYLPLFALLSRRLTNDEVAAVAVEFTGRTDPVSREAIGELIEHLTHQAASDDDVARVRARLGWPTEEPPTANGDPGPAHRPS